LLVIDTGDMDVRHGVRGVEPAEKTVF
jgi:hypothetical protein